MNRHLLSAAAALAVMLTAGSESATAQVDSVLAVSKAGSSLLRVNTNGRVGMGTANPQERLHVTGAVRADSGIVFGDGSTQTHGSQTAAAFNVNTTVVDLSDGACHLLGSVTIVAPTAGIILLRAMVRSLVEYTGSFTDILSLNLDTSPGNCSPATANQHSWPSGMPVGIYQETGALQREFARTPGTYTFYLNGIMLSGASSLDRVQYSDLSALFVGN